MSRNTEKFVKGALILSIAGILGKFASAVHRIPLVYMVGDEGMGYYWTIYPIFAILIAAGVVGMPGALSKLVAEEVALEGYDKAHRTFKDTRILALAAGIFFSGLMVLGVEPMIRMGGWSGETRYSVYGLCLAPVFVYVGGAYKGYMQGYQEMFPSAITQIIDNLSKVVFSLSIVVFLLDQRASLGIAVSGAAIGTTVGYVLSMLFMIWEYSRYKRRGFFKISRKDYQHGPGHLKQQFVKIIRLAVPVSITAAVFPIMNVIDSLTLYHAMGWQGMDKQTVTVLLGQMSKVFSVMNFPMVFSMAIATSVLPAVSEALAKHDHEDVQSKIQQGLKLSILIALPAAAGLYILADPIMTLLFPTSPQGGIYLKYYSFCLIFVIVGQGLTGILQGMGKQWIPLLALVSAVLLKVVLNLTLTQTGLGITGSAVASIGYHMTFVLINYLFLKRFIRFKLERKKTLFAPVLAISIMFPVVYYGYALMMGWLKSNGLSTLVAIGAGGVFYLGTLFMVRAFNREELSMIPKGEKIIEKLERRNYFQ